MIWKKQHIADFLRWKGHDPEAIFARLAAHGSTTQDMEAWAALREWYDEHPRMSKDMISEELGLPKYKTHTGLVIARQYMIE